MTDKIVTEAMEPCPFCGQGSTYRDAHRGGEWSHDAPGCFLNGVYIAGRHSIEQWNTRSTAQEPALDDDAELIARLGARIAEQRAHIGRLQAQYGSGSIPDERCAGIVLNFGDVIDLYDRLQAKAPETGEG